MPIKYISNFLVLLDVFIISISGALSQPVLHKNGLYLSVDDFVSGKLSFEKNKFRTDAIFKPSKVIILLPHETKTLNKSDVYGYKVNNCNYRFYKDESYKIIDTAGFYLYCINKDEAAIKGKSLVRTDKYYFSKTASSTILPLTLNFLELTFKSNHSFYTSLIGFFHSDKELILYDNVQKQYRLKYLYNLSKKD